MDNESKPESEPEVIRRQMEETRAALQDKLECLESQVLHTVKDAGQAVESAKETVEAVKEVVHETAAAVKDTVHDTVASVKEAFNIERNVQEHPWGMLAGAAFVGFLGGKLLMRATAVPTPAPMPTMPSPVPSQEFRQRQAHHGKTNGKHHPRTGRTGERESQEKPGIFQQFAADYSKEIAKLKGLAVSALGGMARELAVEVAPPALKEGVTNLVDSITTKLGGEPVEGPILNFKDAPRWERQAS